MTRRTTERATLVPAIFAEIRPVSASENIVTAVTTQACVSVGARNTEAIGRAAPAKKDSAEKNAAAQALVSSFSSMPSSSWRWARRASSLWISRAASRAVSRLMPQPEKIPRAPQAPPPAPPQLLSVLGNQELLRAPLGGDKHEHPLRHDRPDRPPRTNLSRPRAIFRRALTSRRYCYQPPCAASKDPPRAKETNLVETTIKCRAQAPPRNRRYERGAITYATH